MAVKKKKLSREFADLLNDAIAKRDGINANQLSAMTKVNRSYTSRVLNAQQAPSSEWVDLVSEAMNLPETDRVNLHYSAARAHGYYLPRPKK